jgi:transcriptional regulator with XRE-family HTH domain
VNTTPRTDHPASFSQEDECDPLFPQGLIAGAVLRAARQSAGLSPSELAAAVDVSDTRILSWETGAEPLAAVPVPLTGRLKSALRTAGAKARLVDDLDPAAWCDLFFEAISAGEDVTCLLADPLASEPAFTDLFTWVTTGQPPARYAPYADTMPADFRRPGRAVLPNSGAGRIDQDERVADDHGQRS